MLKEFKPRVILSGAALMATALLVLSGSHASAYVPESDLLKIKGYSPEVIQAADVQRSRQEWRQPASPKRTPIEKVFHNIYYGDWTGSVDDFGNEVLRDH